MDTLCTTCGAAIPGDHRFCGRCGTAVSAAPTERTCWQCGTTVPTTTNWCPACGASATATRPPAVGGTPFTTVPFDAPAAPLVTPAAGPTTGVLFEPPPGRGVSSKVPGTPRERTLTPTMATVLVAVAIIIALATVGIIAGQAAGA